MPAAVGGHAHAGRSGHSWDLSGVVLRPLYECWLLGCGFSIKGRRLMTSWWRPARLRSRFHGTAGTWLLGCTGRTRANTQELGALKLTKELAPIVGGHAIAGGPPLLETYFLAYGLLSERDIHHGLEGVVGHILSRGDGFLRIGPHRPEPGARENVTWGGHLLIAFALSLYPRFGLPTEQFDLLASLKADVLLGEWRQPQGPD